MSHCEALPVIQQGLNCITDKKDIERIIYLYKLAVIIKNNYNDDFMKLFSIIYMDYYIERIELINGIKHMTDNNISEIKMIMINNLSNFFKCIKDKEYYKDKYYQKRNSFLELSNDDIRNLIIEECLSGIHCNQNNIDKMKDIVKSIDYSEQKRLEEINIDFEISKVNGKLKHKYTEEGNFESDENVLNVIIDNLNKKGYTSHHLHIYVYEVIDDAINKIVNENKNNYQKVYNS